MTSVLLLADTHIGSSVALCKPSVTLDDGGEYRASPGQSWLWRCWNEMLEQVEREKTGDLYTVINGDAVEGDTKRRSLQTISRNPATITKLAADILDPLAKMSAGLFFVRGTGAHVGKSAHLEEQLAVDMDGTACPETGARSWYHLPLEVEGVRLDIAHHPGVGVGRNPWTAYNAIHTLAARVLFEYANAGRAIPHLVIRSHNHVYRDSLDDYRVRAITLPAWTLATEYIQMIAPGAIADIGAVLVQASAGYYEARVIRFNPRPAPVYSIGVTIGTN